MKKSKEEQFQEAVRNKLQEYDIFPFSVIFTYLGGNSDGLLSITFYIPHELDELLEKLNYKTQCDKSGYLIFRDSNTLILTGLALIQLYTTL